MPGKTSIYAVARTGQAGVQPSELHQYQRTLHAWSIMLESHPMLGIGKSEVVEYCATWDEEAGHHKLHPLELGSHDTIIGSILLSDSAHTSPKKAEEVLKQHQESKSSGLDAGSKPEQWLRHALSVLQQNKILEDFGLGEFMTFANSYVANRQTESTDAPATIAYPKLHPEHEKKAKKHGFWMSYPETASNRNGERIYGGLM